MTLLLRLLAHAPDDPLMLAVAILLAWLPVCAIGLGILELLALAQGYLSARSARSPRMVPIPPETARPLVARRVMSAEPRALGASGAPWAIVRVLTAIGAVLALTAFFLAATQPQLFALLRR